MSRALQTKELEILDILRETGRPLGARLLAQKLAGRGVDLNERTVGYHLLLMDERGLTRMEGERGRVPTELGLRELEKSRASERVGFVSSRIDSLAFQTTFDLEKGAGELVINFSLINRSDLAEALRLMQRVAKAGLGLSDLAILKEEGERMGDVRRTGRSGRRRHHLQRQPQRHPAAAGHPGGLPLRRTAGGNRG